MHSADKNHRRTIRLKDYDYTHAGAYFVTICTHEWECVLGDVVNGEMRLNELGQAVEIEWLKTAEIRDNVELDEFVVMPNHIHSIIVITESCVGATGRSPLRSGPAPKSIGAIVAGFKSAATKRINELRRTPRAPVWQRNYYEHVIRNEDDLNEIREYILSNPVKWELDSDNPRNTKRRA